MCPRFMFVPRFPHLVGNDYYKNADGLCGIVFGMKIVEGNDKKNKRGKDKYHDYGKTGFLLLRLCIPFFMTVKVVIVDSGFGVIYSVIELNKMGVFSSTLIKKRRYWSRYVNREKIKAHFVEALVGASQRLPDKINMVDFDLF